MTFSDDSLRLGTLFSRLLINSPVLHLGVRSEIPFKEKIIRTVLTNKNLSQDKLIDDFLDFRAADCNAELWKSFRALLCSGESAAFRVLNLPTSIYALLREATDADLQRISQKFFCSFRLKESCRTLVNDAFNSRHPAGSWMSEALENFLCAYWLKVWQAAHKNPFQASLMFGLSEDVVQRLPCLSPLDLKGFVGGLSETSYELRFNPYLIEGIIKYREDSMIFSLLQIQHALQKPEDIHQALTWQEPVPEHNLAEIHQDFLLGLTEQEILEKHNISRFHLITMLKQLSQSALFRPGKNQQLVHLTNECSKKMGEMLTMWGMAPQDVCSIANITKGRFRSVRSDLAYKHLLPPRYHETKFVGTQRSKLRLRDKIIASIFLSLYSRFSSSNIYSTVNIPAMIAAQIIVENIIKEPSFAQLQPNPFNPTDAWVWCTDLLTATAKLVHCPRCGSLYIARIADTESQSLPDDDSYDPNIDYLHPCPYCRYINAYCKFGYQGQSQRVALKRNETRDVFFKLLAKEISLFAH